MGLDVLCFINDACYAAAEVVTELISMTNKPSEGGGQECPLSKMRGKCAIQRKVTCAWYAPMAKRRGDHAQFGSVLAEDRLAIKPGDPNGPR